MDNKELVERIARDIMTMLSKRIFSIAFNQTAQEIVKELVVEIVSKNLDSQLGIQSLPADFGKSGDPFSGEPGVAC